MMVRPVCVSMVLILLALVSPGRGANRQEVLGVASRQPALKVIDEKCLACHNRQRIETAARDRRDMERIVRRMERKGVALTEKERQVLGHFWQKNPFAEDAEKSSPSRRGGGALPR